MDRNCPFIAATAFSALVPTVSHPGFTASQALTLGAMCTLALSPHRPLLTHHLRSVHASARACGLATTPAPTHAPAGPQSSVARTTQSSSTTAWNQLLFLAFANRSSHPPCPLRRLRCHHPYQALRLHHRPQRPRDTPQRALQRADTLKISAHATASSCMALTSLLATRASAATATHTTMAAATLVRHQMLGSAPTALAHCHSGLLPPHR